MSAIVLLPLLGGLVLLALDPRDPLLVRRAALGTTLLTFVVSLGLLLEFDAAAADFQFVEYYAWIPDFGVAYHVGVDGISLFLVLLTTLLSPLVVLSTWSSVTERVKEYLVCFLVLETGMIGAFVAVDLFLFYVFWEVMLIPMYFLIGVWGGARRIYAALKFLLYTLAGSLLMLVAILYLAALHDAQFGRPSFDLLHLAALDVPAHVQGWLFAAFGLSFAIKVPLFPFHTWLPDAHVEAPTGGSVILAAVLLKMGTYGFLRFALPLFPDAALAAAPLVMTLSVIGIVYGALVAMVQPDLKKLVAYSSVSHLGFVMLGVFAFNMQGTQGALYQMLGHGLSTGALFLLVGVVYERRHTRLIGEYGGLWKRMPVFATVFLVTLLSSIGLPGLNGFVGEFLILLGAFAANRWAGGAALAGVVLGAVYMLRMYQRVMFGPLTNPANAALPDLSRREVTIFAPLVGLMLLMGVYPQPFLSRMAPSVEATLTRVHAVGRTAAHETMTLRVPAAPSEPAAAESLASDVRAPHSERVNQPTDERAAHVDRNEQ